MKKTALALGLVAALGLTACSSTKQKDVGTGGAIPAGPQQAISEQRLSNDFKRQGVRVIYSTFGGVEAIETTGYAAVWGNSQNAAREAFRVAEMEAKKSLVEFLNQERFNSAVSVRMISRNLEKARDNKLNNFATNRREDIDAVTTDDEVQTSGDTSTSTNTASRDDALNIASRVSVTMTNRSQGILSGLRLVQGDVINDGRNVRVVYRWDQKNEEAIRQIRNSMMR